MPRRKQTSISCRAMRHRRGLANRGCRRLRPRYATRFLPPPRSASGNCLLQRQASPRILFERLVLSQRWFKRVFGDWLGVSGRTGSGGCACAHNQTRLHDDFSWIRRIRWRRDALKQRLCRDYAHFTQRLPNGRQRRILKSGTLNVVKAHNGHILGNTAAGFTQRLDGADRGNIIERKETRERFFRGEKFFRNLISEFW